MTTGDQENRNPSKKLRDPDLIGAEAAMLRASEHARRRAIDTSGAVTIFRNGKIVREKDVRKIFLEENQGN